MRTARLHEALQWFALLGGALAWATQFVLGFWIAASRCYPANAGWRVPEKAFYTAATAPAALVALLAEAAAVWLYLQLRDHDSTPPGGRHVFFAYASIAGNVLFLALILLEGIGVLYHLGCVQA
ncbi:MAG: hypothetical protein ACXVZL_12410 [Gaiellaceae bacterium]